MPELPEVEVMCRRLKNWVARNIEDVSIFRDNGRYLPGDELEQLRQATFKWPTMERRGKYIIFHTDRGLLICHNAMSGFWDALDEPWTFDYVEGKRTATDRDVRISIRVVGGLDHGPPRTIRFHDARLFGSLRFYSGAKTWRDVPPLARLGSDAYLTEMLGDAPQWTSADLIASRDKHPHWPVKRVLMNQSHVAGLGNIYVAEILHRSGVNPWRAIGAIPPEICFEIVQRTRQVLAVAVHERLQYGKYLKVYHRKNCGACSHEITRKTMDGRSTYHCEVCQK